MSSARLKLKRGSVTNLVIPETEAERRVSLTGYTNVVLDVSSNNNKQDEDKDNVRVRFADVPSVGLAMSGYEDKPRRKYSVALQTLKPFRPSSKDGKLPLNKVGFFSYIFLSWFSGFVWKMFRNRAQPINESDVWQCSDEEGANVNAKRLKRLWDEEVRKQGQQKASFLKVWVRFAITRTWVALSMLIVNALVTFSSSALLVNKVVAYLESPEDDMIYGLGICIAIFSCEVIRAITFANMIVFSCQTSTRFRSGMMGIVYEKLLRMRTVKGKTNSEIINVFGVDSYRVYIATWTVGFLLSLPVYLIIGTVYCYTLIGYWCFVSVGSFVICYFGQSFLSRFIASIRRLCVQYTDLRVRRMGEVLNNMKCIKMYAWEKPFTDAINEVRNSEQKYVLQSSILNGIITSIIPITPTIASVVTISVYTAAGNSLTASTAFAIVGTMNFLRIIVALLPFALRAYAEAKVSFERIKNLLLMEEHVKPTNEVFDKDNAIEVKAANFIWEIFADPAIKLDDKSFSRRKQRKSSVGSLADSRRSSVSTFALTDINLDVKRGSLVGICGSVGGGKSSLMFAILGRMIQQKGHLAVDGEIAYVSQQAWIFNATLKENILFGKDYDEKRYKEVISSCGLDPDIQMLSDGDETEIGERGANLSGGQKQRVNLARAVYSDSDIFILDDPMSALDVKVGRQLFHNCIKGVLKGKTILLVTHQLQYLKYCDEVVVMEEGTIEEKGLHHELIETDGIYAKMFRIFDNTTMKPVQTEGSGKTSSATNIKPKTPATPTSPSKDKMTEKNGILKVKKAKTVVNIIVIPDQTTTAVVILLSTTPCAEKLVLAEESVIGDISFSIYNSYIKAGGGWIIVSATVLLYFIAAGSLVFTDWWLSQWLTALNMKQDEGRHNMTHDNNMTQGHNMSGMFTTITSNITNTSSDASVKDSGYSALIIKVSDDTFFLVYVLCIAGVILLQLIKAVAGAMVGVTASNKFHAGCLDNVMKAKMVFFDSNPVGRILNRFSKDLDESDVFIPQVAQNLLQILALVVISTAMTVYITPWLLIAVVPLLIIFYVMKQMSSVAIRQLKRLENITRSPLISHVNVSATGLPTIVAYNQQDRFVERCEELGDVASLSLFLFDVSMRWIGLRLDLVAGMMTVTTSVIFVLTKGSISPASAGLVLGLCGKTISIVQFLVRMMNECEARFTSIERLQEYNTSVETEPQHGDKLAEPRWPDRGEVVFKDVVMSYRKDMDPVLRTVNFQIGSQEKVGVVGRTGAGKSSLAAALFRLVELGGGKIIVDGEDISKLHLNAIRSKISTITQEPVLFAGTVRYNIDPFSLYSDDKIWESLEKVHMKEKIEEYDEGLDVMVEENGENFSVGERQLLCLARAVLRSSKILLLDEATANIDTSTDAMIQQTIKDCFTDCTVITIAHRLNTVLHSDRIIVLDAGKVMESASPQDLLTDPNSYFNSMIAAQTVKTPSP